MSHFYLKPNAIAEPLFNQWYAWSYLIPPSSAALYIANSHLKILESFVESPQVHQTALQDPAMRGGPFIHYGASRVSELQLLLERTRSEQADLLKLATAIQTLDNLLRQEAKGYSLEPLYKQIPEPLRGYVELVYDANHQPAIRLIEGLLYRSSYYKPASQTVALYLGNEDSRSFVLSTPRLSDSTSLHLQIPFADGRWNELFKMREIAQSYTYIKDLLQISDSDHSIFSSLFTEVAPNLPKKYSGEQVRIRYFGHACILIQTQTVNILCDPLISYQHQSDAARYTYTDLPDVIDYVLITHNHQDHIMFETLLQLRYKIRKIIVPKSNKGSLIDPSLKLILQAVGFSDVQEVDELEQIDLADGWISSLPVLGEHGDLNIGAKTAYLIHLKGQSILCAADSNNIEPQLYVHLRNCIGNIDVIFVGMECDGAPYTWAYSPLLTQSVPRKMAQTRRLDGSNAEKAIKLIQQFSPQQVYVYAMGQEPWLTHITSIQYTPTSRPILESDRLITHCRQQGIHSERLLGCREILLSSKANSNPLINLSSPGQKESDQDIHEDSSVGQQKDILYLPIQDWLAELARQDIKFTLDHTSAEPRLKCNAPKGTLTAELQAKLKDRKTEIIAFLTAQGTSGLDLAAEATLDPAIFPTSTAVMTQPQHILLTGATGFFGAFLLAELLQQTEAVIHCLIRADSVQQAKQRLEQCLNSYGIEQNLNPRIVPLSGDLSKPLLGLPDDLFHSLAEQIDVIYHNGAWVHHTLPYAQLKATNVLGTEEILRFACCSKPKPVHFISTISVFVATQTGVQTIFEHDSLDPNAMPSGGYAQSKWVAERLVTIAQERGLPVCIYRPGAISGHSQTGVFNRNDFLYKLIQGCVQLGQAPDIEMSLNLLPVDYVSQAIIYLSQQQHLTNQAFHFVHPNPISSTLLFDLLRARQYNIETIPYDQWRQSLINVANGSPNHPLYSIISLFSTSHAQSQSERAMSLEFDCQNTTQELSNSAIRCPPIDFSLLNTYIDYLVDNNLLPQSQQKTSLIS
jgi:thioester reductase-like protein